MHKQESNINPLEIVLVLKHPTISMSNCEDQCLMLRRNLMQITTADINLTGKQGLNLWPKLNNN